MIIKLMKKEYYQRRYWGHMARIMHEKLKNRKVRTGEQLQTYINKPGIAFSFDDSFRVEHWYKYGKDLFGFYDVRVTFNINAYHPFEGGRELLQQEIDMLIDLQSQGHEIAHHGLKHRSAKKYTEKMGLNKWIEDDISSLFFWIEKQKHSITNEMFKKPVTYAFPFSEYDENHINELVPRFFKVVRGKFDKNYSTPMNLTGFAPSIYIDSLYLFNAKSLNKILTLARDAGINVIFMCHSILPNDVDWDDFGWGLEAKEDGKWRVSPDTIKKIIHKGKKLGFEFYTTAEMAGVATFIDRNFDNCVRRLIGKSSDQWVLIQDLSSIKELDLSNEDITNLDGIQYFVNLERLILSSNNMVDFRLLNKLPNLKTELINRNA